MPPESLANPYGLQALWQSGDHRPRLRRRPDPPRRLHPHPRARHRAEQGDRLATAAALQITAI